MDIDAVTLNPDIMFLEHFHASAIYNKAENSNFVINLKVVLLWRKAASVKWLIQVCTMCTAAALMTSGL